MILDSHIWVWFNLEPGRLSENLLVRIASEPVVAISAISIWEVLLAIEKGRIVTNVPGDVVVGQWLTGNPFDVLPVDAEIASLSRSLLFRHDDPADRFIAATAYHRRMDLATIDSRLTELPWLKTVA